MNLLPGSEREEENLLAPFPSNETVISDECSSCIRVERDVCCLLHRNGQKMGKKESGFHSA